MEKKIRISRYLLLLLIIILSTDVWAQGFLSVKIELGTVIFIDSTRIGENSFSYLPLAAGKYTVRTYNPLSLDWSERGFEQKIEIRDNEYIDLDFTDSSQIKISTLPIGSKVYNGDAFIGWTPITFDKKFLSSSSLRLEKEGYITSDISISPKQNKYTVKLQPLVDRKDLVVSRITDNQNQLKWYKEGLVVTSILSSWASFYFKRRADETFAKYQRTSDSRQLVELYSQTERYDTLAEIAIGVSVATLGTYFYLLLTD